MLAKCFSPAKGASHARAFTSSNLGVYIQPPQKLGGGAIGL